MKTEKQLIKECESHKLSSSEQEKFWQTLENNKEKMKNPKFAKRVTDYIDMYICCDPDDDDY